MNLRVLSEELYLIEMIAVSLILWSLLIILSLIISDWMQKKSRRIICMYGQYLSFTNCRGCITINCWWKHSLSNEPRSEVGMSISISALDVKVRRKYYFLRIPDLLWNVCPVFSHVILSHLSLGSKSSWISIENDAIKRASSKVVFVQAPVFVWTCQDMLQRRSGVLKKHTYGLHF